MMRELEISSNKALSLFATEDGSRPSGTLRTTDALIEKDDSVVEYSYKDTMFYIYTNTGVPCAVWQQNDFLCSLDGDVTEEELYKIIHSIF